MRRKSLWAAVVMMVGTLLFLTGSPLAANGLADPPGADPAADAAPSAPVLTSVRLVGACHSITELQWSLSADDGAGENDVIAYDLYGGGEYDPTGAAYSLFESLPAGTTSTIDPPGGCAIPGMPRFYAIRARDAAGQSTASADQGGKSSRDIGAFVGPGRALVSVAFEQADWSVATVLQSVTWTHARTFGDIAGGASGWRTVDLARGVGGIALDRTKAFWVHLEGGSFFWQAGIVPRVTDIVLRPGWNLVGFPSATGRTVSEVFTGIDYQSIEAYEDNAPFNLRRLGSTDLMTATGGYWIHVREAAILTVTN